MRTRLQPTAAELAARDQVLKAVLAHIRSGMTIRLPVSSPITTEGPRLDSALLHTGTEPNEFGSAVGEFRYQFEGEDDLLHLMVVRNDLGPIEVQVAQEVAEFAMPDMPHALIWLKPGERSQHFYVGHDDLLAANSDR